MENGNDSVYVSHTAQYKKWYEPFTIVPNTAPLYDERFIGYGFTRNTQVTKIYFDKMAISFYFECHRLLPDNSHDQGLDFDDLKIL